MDETTLRGLLAETLTDEPPMGPVTQYALHAGLRIRRRRRLLAASGGVAVVAAASLGLASIHLAGGPPAPVAPAAQSQADHTIWATNDGPGAIMQISQDGQVGHPIQIGPDLNLPVFSQDGKTLAVITNASGKVGELAAVDVATGNVSQRIGLVGKYVTSVAITPDDKTAYVATLLNNKVTPYDLAQGTTGPPIKVGVHPEALVITSDGRTMYVLSDAAAGSDQGEVTPITLATGQAGPPIQVGDFARTMEISPDGKTLLVANLEKSTVNDGSVTLIDTATNTATKPLKIGHVSGAGLAFSPDGQTAYVVDSYPSRFTPINLATKTAGKPIKLADATKVLNGPEAIALTPDGKTAYALSPSLDPKHDSLVTPIDTAAGTAGKPIVVPGIADSIAVSPDGKTVYLGGYNPGKLTPISTSTNQVGPDIPTPEGVSISVVTGP